MTKFDELKGKLAAKPGVSDPAALAAAIGRKKLGDKEFNARAAAGRRKKKHRPVDKKRMAMVQQYMKKQRLP